MDKIHIIDPERANNITQLNLVSFLIQAVLTLRQTSRTQFAKNDDFSRFYAKFTELKSHKIDRNRRFFEFLNSAEKWRICTNSAEKIVVFS